MKIIPALLSLFAISRAALIPIKSSSMVNVKNDRTGEGYSYSIIHENKGFPVQPTTSVTTIPKIFIKTDARQKQHDLNNGEKQKIITDYVITNVHIPVGSVIQPYPFNLVPVGFV